MRMIDEHINFLFESLPSSNIYTKYNIIRYNCNSNINKLKIMEMAQMVKFLPCKPEDLSLDTGIYMKPGTALGIYKPCTMRVRHAGS